MIRILTSILAVVAAILAVVLMQPLLFAVAGVLVVSVIVMLVVMLKSRHRQAHQPYLESTPDPERDLKSLGILEIKPREGSRPMKPAADEETGVVAHVAESGASERAPVAKSAHPGEETAVLSPDAAGDGAAGTPEQSDHEHPVGEEEHVRSNRSVTIRKRDPMTFVAVEAVADWLNEDVMVSCLHSLRAALGAHSVCLLRQEEIALRYRVEAMVSQNSYARSWGRFSTRTPLMLARMADRPVSIRRVSDQDLSPRSLGYYNERIDVRELALAPLIRLSERSTFLLIADTRKEGSLDTPFARGLLAQYADVVSSILLSEPEKIPTGSAASVEASRPRREIIADEMVAAREDQHPLALALVHMNDPILASEEGHGTERIESLFREQLTILAPEGRIERFGEMTFGVFFHNPGVEVEHWARSLQSEMHRVDEQLSGAVVVGVVLLGDRHESPEEFRDEAMAALYEAYETGGTCIILDDPGSPGGEIELESEDL